MKLAHLLLLSLLYCACVPSNVYEKNVSIQSNRWKSSFKPTYTFEISDTLKNYQPYLTIRHTDAYPFSNIWLKVNVKKPGDSVFTGGPVDITLAQSNGKWLGRGMQDIWEHQLPLSARGEAIHFSRTGTYSIQLEQIMRIDPLPEVMSVGVRLEKITH
ncbi:MAG: gliding motility lipoprotein GldH [Chitinophagaceae bacterium]|nr:gliding motility lipoprotein GldH [Chitinophagaceae bacterium]